jgi:hypothetical protein
VQTLTDQRLEVGHNVGDKIRHTLERFENRITLDNPRFAERYIEQSFMESGALSDNKVRPTPKWQRPLLALHRSNQNSVWRLLLGGAAAFVVAS